MSSKKSKLIQCGELILGVCGICPPNMNLDPYPATEQGVHDLAEEYTDMFKERGHGTNEGGAMLYPFAALIVGPGIGPYYLDSAGTPIEFSEEYAACGSGENYALGVLSFLRDAGEGAEVSAYDAVVSALSAACKHDPNTRGPLDTISIPPPPPVEPKTKPIRTRSKRGNPSEGSSG